MKTSLYWISRGYLAIMLFVSLFFDINYWLFGPNEHSVFNLVGYLFGIFYPLIFLGMFVSVVIIISTTSINTRAMTVWRWIFCVTVLLVMILSVPVFPLDMAIPDTSRAFFAVFDHVAQVIVYVSGLGYVISEWIAKRRIDITG